MIDRRRFLKLFAGGMAAAAHGGIPALVLKPVKTAVQALDLDSDFSGSLYGLLVNARLSRFSGYGVDWTKATIDKPIK